MKTVFFGSMAAVLALAGCDNSGEPAAGTADSEEPAATAAAQDESAGATVATAEGEEVGTYLVDGDGRSLYIFENGNRVDGDEDVVRSDCAGECADSWPPFTSTGDPQAGESLEADKVGSMVRQDSTRQVTYDGWPLYYYHDDTAAGDINGQNVHDEWGGWYLLSPDGEPIETEIRR